MQNGALCSVHRAIKSLSNRHIYYSHTTITCTPLVQNYKVAIEEDYGQNYGLTEFYDIQQKIEKTKQGQDFAGSQLPNLKASTKRPKHMPAFQQFTSTRKDCNLPVLAVGSFLYISMPIPSIAATTTPATRTSQSPVCPRIVASAFAVQKPKSSRNTFKGMFFLAEFSFSRSCLPPAVNILPNRVPPRLELASLKLCWSPFPDTPPVFNAKAIFHPALLPRKLKQGNEKHLILHGYRNRHMIPLIVRLRNTQQVQSIKNAINQTCKGICLFLATYIMQKRNIFLETKE